MYKKFQVYSPVDCNKIVIRNMAIDITEGTRDKKEVAANVKVGGGRIRKKGGRHTAPGILFMCSMLHPPVYCLCVQCYIPRYSVDVFSAISPGIMLVCSVLHPPVYC